MTTQSGEGGKQAASPTMTLKELQQQATNGDTFTLYTEKTKYRCKWTDVKAGQFELPVGKSHGNVDGAPDAKVRPDA